MLIERIKKIEDTETTMVRDFVLGFYSLRAGYPLIPARNLKSLSVG